jgi:hypothetical protein
MTRHFPKSEWAHRVGLGTEFRSEKIPRNRLGMISVIPRKKVLIPKHSEFRGKANSEARNGTERNGIPRKNEVLRNLHRTHGLYDFSDIEPGSNWRPHPCKGCMVNTTLSNSKMISPYLKSRLFWHYYWNFGLPSFVFSRFLFRGMVRKGIPTVCFHIFSTERNSELFSLPLKDSEGNSDSMLLFLYPRKGILSCFLFRGRVRNGIPRFSVPWNSRDSVGNNHLFCLFRLPRKYFLSEIPNTRRTPHSLWSFLAAFYQRGLIT